ncbi:DegV family protein [Halopseudomonas pertucinogena]|uniref:DegV domain-containing protein n=1 Tax=Halopseudomonas pertucinogena TaxID=86175 RepID=A0ABQ2CTU9_9GAMM|nr:DegV family protein [Halopseudomonas pertucinogena]GGJ05552.1 DegV domain-containing protein [Halopseudomonas pertucinogena]
MRVGLIVDSACELPYSFIQENNIFILPVTVRVDGETFVDDHDPVTTRRFYTSGRMSLGHQAETAAFTPEQIHDLFMREVVTQYDFAFLETIARARSDIHDNANEAMHRIIAGYKPYREAAGLSGRFAMRVVDSRTVFAGQGLLAAHTVHLIRQGVGKNALRQQVDDFTQHIYGCAIPRDLDYIRQRSLSRGEKSVSAVSAFLARHLKVTPVIWGQGHQGGPVFRARSFEAAVERMIDYACGCIRKGLLSPYVVFSAGMEEQEMADLPGFDRLQQTCRDHGVTLLASPANITSNIYAGPGGAGLALAAAPHRFQDMR